MNAQKTIAISLLSIVGIALLLVLSSPVWMGWLIQKSYKDTYEVISKVDLECGSGATQEIQVWSKAGYSVSCRRGEAIDGPWQAWEGGYMHIDGGFINNKKHGTWKVYSRGGSLYRTIEYEKGAEISNVIHGTDNDT